MATPEQTKLYGPALPMQCVWTRKHPDQSGYRRYRCKAVVCGNWQPADIYEQVFTSQVDIATLLVAIRLAAWIGWAVTSLDVKGAFLYAPYLLTLNP